MTWRYYKPKRLPAKTSKRGRWVLAIMLIVVGLLVLFNSGCTTWLPMTETLSALPEKDVARIVQETGVPAEVVRDPTIHRVSEVELGCWQLVQKCWPGVKWYMKALGSVPLACTEIWQMADHTKEARIYTCWWTTAGTLAHEREHARGKTHNGW
jgi:hypothetical protein